jgi:UDP-glucose 4-epimerase
MRILVTGGAGFIGSHVVDAFIEEGHEVAVLDNFSSGKGENIPPSVIVYKGLIQDRNFVRGVIQEFKPDIIDHHAAQISVTVSARDSFIDAESNILGTNAILMELIECAPNAKLIYASSGGAMYGNTSELPYLETSTPQAHSPYGLSKYVAEQYVWMYAKLHGLQATVLRYANVYGPRQDPHGEAGVCAIFADRMNRGQSVTIYGDGKAIRDYVYVSDVAQANVAALTKAAGEAVNISTGAEISTQDVYQQFSDAFGSATVPEYAPLRKGEVAASVLSPKKAEHVLGWTPQHSFAEGVAKTVKWYKTDEKSQTPIHE